MDCQNILRDSITLPHCGCEAFANYNRTFPFHASGKYSHSSPWKSISVLFTSTHKIAELNCSLQGKAWFFIANFFRREKVLCISPQVLKRYLATSLSLPLKEKERELCAKSLFHQHFIKWEFLLFSVITGWKQNCAYISWIHFPVIKTGWENRRRCDVARRLLELEKDLSSFINQSCLSLKNTFSGFLC